MCSTPKSHGSTKVLKPHYGGILSGLDKQARLKFTQRANLAAETRALKREKAKQQKQPKQPKQPKKDKSSSLLSYFHLALND